MMLACLLTAAAALAQETRAISNGAPFDPTKTLFNIDAGFERDTAD